MKDLSILTRINETMIRVPKDKQYKIAANCVINFSKAVCYHAESLSSEVIRLCFKEEFLGNETEYDKAD